MPAQVSLDLSSPPVEDQASLPALVQLRNVGKRFGAVQVLRELNLDIYSGEIHALMGETAQVSQLWSKSYLASSHNMTAKFSSQGNSSTLTIPARLRQRASLLCTKNCRLFAR